MVSASVAQWPSASERQTPGFPVAPNFAAHCASLVQAAQACEVESQIGLVTSPVQSALVAHSTQTFCRHTGVAPPHALHGFRSCPASTVPPAPLEPPAPAPPAAPPVPGAPEWPPAAVPPVPAPPSGGQLGPVHTHHSVPRSHVIPAPQSLFWTQRPPPGPRIGSTLQEDRKSVV